VIDTLVRRVKLIFVLGVAAVVVGGLWIAVGGYRDLEGDRHVSELGPREPGLEKRTGCRYMTIEVEGRDDDETRFSGRGHLNADLGPPAGKITSQAITVKNASHPDNEDLDDWAFRQEFCSMPGSKLSAVVTMIQRWDELECFFRAGPLIHEDDATTRRGKINETTMTTCEGVVP
jgi:hypothetical protein